MSYGFTDAYPNARVTLMTRKLLPQGAIAAALDKSLQENAPLFAQTEAQLLLPDDAERQLRSIEQRRLSLLLNDVLILSRGLFGPARDFLLYWTQIFELMNLKAILRGRIAGGDPVRERLLDMGPFARLPVDALLRADSETEMIRILDGTPFANIAWQARHVVEQRHDFFYLDTAFDRLVYNGLAWRAARVPTQDRRSLERLMSCVIDGTNLAWLLRYRFFYELPPAEVYYLLISRRTSLLEHAAQGIHRHAKHRGSASPSSPSVFGMGFRGHGCRPSPGRDPSGASPNCVRSAAPFAFSFRACLCLLAAARAGPAPTGRPRYG